VIVALLGCALAAAPTKAATDAFSPTATDATQVQALMTAPTAFSPTTL
jgi:hypothetical protein